VRGRELVAGKLLALAGFAAVALVPALAALAWLALGGRAPLALTGMLAAGYGAWLLLWSMAVVGISALFARGRDALLALLAVWAVLVILLPRLAPDVAATAVNLPTRLETHIAVQRAYRALGDAHNPDDPYFAAFREQTLRQYAVTRVEDLPVNYKGLVGMEGERLSSALFNRYAATGFALQAAQSRMVDGFGWVSPVLALRRLSMSASGTDLASYQDFLEQAEAYRYALVQGLNKLEAEQIAYADGQDPNKENRVSRAHWHDMPSFHYRAPAARDMVQRAAPAGIVLLCWLLGLAAASWWVAARLGRAVR